MTITDGAINDNLIYSSPRILDRRRRILEVARELIARHGMDGFGIRELCQRANVSPQTIYKAFESKERVIALALRHHFQSYADEHEFLYPGDSLFGVVERMLASDINTRKMGAYVAAVVAIYFSQTARQDVREAASFNVFLTLEPWITSLQKSRGLRPGIEPQRLMADIAGLLFVASLEWSRGILDDEAYMLRKLEVVLTYGAGATRGAQHREIVALLADILGSGEKLEPILKIAKSHAG